MVHNTISHAYVWRVCSNDLNCKYVAFQFLPNTDMVNWNVEELYRQRHFHTPDDNRILYDWSYCVKLRLHAAICRAEFRFC